jgi:hypothetical protein
MVPRQPEQLLELEDLELDHEWLQLIQMERTIENQKNQLLKNKVKGCWDPDEDRETFWTDEEGPANKQDDHLDDGDLEYINVILNSISRQNCNHDKSNNLKLESFTPEDALTRAFAPLRTPQEFNLKFNQNSMTAMKKITSVTFQTLKKKDPLNWEIIFLTTKKMIVGTKNI